MLEINFQILISFTKVELFHNMRLISFLCCFFFASHTTNFAKSISNEAIYSHSVLEKKNVSNVTLLSEFNIKFFNSKSSLHFNKRFQPECGLISISYFDDSFIYKPNYANINFIFTKCFTLPPFNAFLLRGPPILQIKNCLFI